ncbi:MAG TPA: phenylalanine--tRNA ligase subunit beta [Longimicrobium sp.]|jgi:phenylalanyl-tRNA synthetase beta chain|uniref:phenylalanine--tRNA ligase subunit beta n=1 Tax=Longimicrobium sp. TaxID=2029185 RepID=UPI002ED9F3D1
MNISYRWLQSLAPGLRGTPQEFAERLALLGAPVDEITDLGAEIGDVLIARVAEVRQHPNADRLRVCTVDAGGGTTLQVVCGAPNVEAGGLYPFAPIGATLPGGLEIKKAKLRGEVSEGMLCSARELGLGRDHGGLMTLHGDFSPGAQFRQALGLDDHLLVVDVTPNRGELLSHVGVARELAPGGEDGVTLPGFGGRAASYSVTPGRRHCDALGMDVEIEDEDACSRYLGAIIRGVNVGPSPEWLASRLRAVGLRPINNVVDATNYVLHELGQPIHAFDLAKLRGGRISVRAARDGEALTTLDGTERALVATDLIIADGEGPVALAGVMGGANSEVDEGTTELFIEVALFTSSRVRRTGRRFGLSTDASYRFERGVDPEGQPAALQRVVDLIVATAGGEAQGAVDLVPHPFERRAVGLRPERVRQVLGVELSADEVRGLLEPIGFEVNTRPTPMRVLVPGFRPDVMGEIDLIEELARRRGYDTFAEELVPHRPSAVPEHPIVAVEARLRALFVRWGFLEARTIPFAPESGGTVPLLTPLSAEEGYLRSAMVPGLLRRVRHNFAHAVRDVRLFEIGSVFHQAVGGGAGEERRIAAAFTGGSRPAHWSGPAPEWDLWDLKGLMEELAAEYPDGRVESAEGGLVLRTADGVIGEARVATAEEVDAPAWAGDVLVLEARLPAAAISCRDVRHRDLPVHPGSERDLALLVPTTVAAGEVDATIRGSAGDLLQSVAPFDLYEGKGIPEGTRSIAFRLRYRAPERTLTDAEVDESVARVLGALEERHGVRRR